MEILLVDDHPLIREGLLHLLLDAYPSASVTQAEDANQTRSTLDRHPPYDLILLDLSIPGAAPWELLLRARSAHPSTPVVIISADDSRATVTTALDHGAMGFISKRSPTKVLVQALSLVLAGGIYITPEALAPNASPSPPTTVEGSRRVLMDLGFTDREMEVLALLVQGKPNKAICRDLDIAESTVKTHISSILRILKAENRTQILYSLSHLGIRLPLLPTPVRDTG